MITRVLQRADSFSPWQLAESRMKLVPTTDASYFGRWLFALSERIGAGDDEDEDNVITFLDYATKDIIAQHRTPVVLKPRVLRPLFWRD